MGPRPWNPRADRCKEDYVIAGNGTTVTHEFWQIEACGCETCDYDPFSPGRGGGAAPEGSGYGQTSWTAKKQ